MHILKYRAFCYITYPRVSLGELKTTTRKIFRTVTHIISTLQHVISPPDIDFHAGLERKIDSEPKNKNKIRTVIRLTFIFRTINPVINATITKTSTS